MKYEIEYYQRENETIPVLEFLKSLEDKKLRAKTFKEIDLLGRFGSDLREPYVTAIKGEKYRGLWELRTQFSTNLTRIFYFVIQNNKCILLHGIVKKTQKPPVGDLDRALDYKLDFERRCAEDE